MEANGCRNLKSGESQLRFRHGETAPNEQLVCVTAPSDGHVAFPRQALREGMTGKRQAFEVKMFRFILFFPSLFVFLRTKRTVEGQNMTFHWRCVKRIQQICQNIFVK